MKYVWDTKGESKLLEVAVRSEKPQQIIITVEDCCKPDSYYSKHVDWISGKNGVDVFEISLPVTPQKAFFEVRPYSDFQGTLPWGDVAPNNSLVWDIREKPFTLKWNCTEVDQTPLLKEFLAFASWFSQNAGVLKAAYNSDETVYTSKDKNFEFRYLPEIIDDEPMRYNQYGQLVKNENYGRPLPTSNRVHIATKKMQLAQKYVKTYTYPQRMVLLVHEFAHGWINKDPDSEFEADYNSIMICRCLGFSKREIGTAYTAVFFRYQSDENVERIYRIKKLLEQLP